MHLHTCSLILVRYLHQEEGEQTSRMAVAILANAIIFHMRLSRLHAEIGDLAGLKVPPGIFLKSDVLDCWREILAINYWPIFQALLSFL